MVIVQLLLYSDDFSGNRTKKWNCFDAWSLLLAGLPKHMNAQFENIHQICASNNDSPLEMAVPMVDDLMVLQDGMKMFDAYLNREVLVLAPVIACMCDNSRASELVGHLRGSSNGYCCQCLKYDVNGCILIIIAYAVKNFMHIQADKNVSPGIICAVRTKSELLDHFNPLGAILCQQ